MELRNPGLYCLVAFCTNKTKPKNLHIFYSS